MSSRKVGGHALFICKFTIDIDYRYALIAV
jgi:hypothetical protein